MHHITIITCNAKLAHYTLHPHYTEYCCHHITITHYILITQNIAVITLPLPLHITITPGLIRSRLLLYNWVCRAQRNKGNNKITVLRKRRNVVLFKTPQGASLF
jgi:hypothetical protein